MDFFATCARGTEGALRRELTRLRVTRVRGDRGGVWFGGDLGAGMRVCLHSRTAVRVLLQLGTAQAAGSDALYEAARAIDWSAWLTPKSTLAVEAIVRDSELTHSHYAALKVKDAIVDAIRERTGNRPDVDPRDPDVRVVLHLAKDQATLALDLAGEPLHKRGYRVAMADAPMKETLAAAVLALGGIEPDAARTPDGRPLVDPMCGSGTFLIEHALAARRVPPGSKRAFGFQRWPGYRGEQQAVWDRLREEARTLVFPGALAPIVGRDVLPEVVDTARRNAAAAGVGADIVFEVGRAEDFRAGALAPGTLIANPPYGERLGAPEPPARGGERGEGRDRGGDPARRPRRPNQGSRAPDPLEQLYRDFARTARDLAGWDVIVLSGNTLFEHAMKIPAKISHRLWNGPLEVRLLKWHIR